MHPDVVKYKKEAKAFIDSDKTNHERHKFLLELLFAVYEHAKEENVNNFNLVWETNELMLMLQDMLECQLRLCTEPFNKLNGDGIIRDL